MEIKSRIVGHGNKPAADFTANPLNWRKHSKAQVAALRAVLGEVGWVQNVIVNNRTGQLIDGHARVELAAQNNESVPFVAVDLAPEEERLILATLDPIAAMATEDTARLDTLLKSLAVKDAAVQAMLDGLAKTAGLLFDDPSQVDAIPTLDRLEDLQAQWQTRPGQLWRLGDHRLSCGDCTDRDVVQRLMGDERAAVFATDPPYLVDYDGTGHPSKYRRNNNKDWSKEYGKLWNESIGNGGLALWDGFIAVARAVALQDNAAWYCWHSSSRHSELKSIWEKHGAFVHQHIIWIKNTPILTRSWYLWQHEPCLMGWVKGHKPKRAAKVGLRSVWFDEGAEEDWQTLAVDPDLYAIDEAMEVLPPESDVWRINHAGFNRKDNLHPTIKPVKIFEIPLQQHTVPGEVCYEPFSGSGTQIIAAERLNRRCLAAEINPVFVAVALQRFLDATGKQPELVAE